MTDRAHLTRVITDAQGNVNTAPLTISVYQPGTTTLLGDLLYAANTGASGYTNPFTISTGIVDFYLNTPQRVDLKVDDGSRSTVYSNVDVLEVVTGGGGGGTGGAPSARWDPQATYHEGDSVSYEGVWARLNVISNVIARNTPPNSPTVDAVNLTAKYFPPEETIPVNIIQTAANIKWNASIAGGVTPGTNTVTFDQPTTAGNSIVLQFTGRTTSTGALPTVPTGFTQAIAHANANDSTAAIYFRSAAPSTSSVGLVLANPSVWSDVTVVAIEVAGPISVVDAEFGAGPTANNLPQHMEVTVEEDALYFACVIEESSDSVQPMPPNNFQWTELWRSSPTGSFRPGLHWVYCGPNPITGSTTVNFNYEFGWGRSGTNNWSGVMVAFRSDDTSQLVPDSTRIQDHCVSPWDYDESEYPPLYDGDGSGYPNTFYSGIQFPGSTITFDDYDRAVVTPGQPPLIGAVDWTEIYPMGALIRSTLAPLAPWTTANVTTWAVTEDRHGSAVTGPYSDESITYDGGSGPDSVTTKEAGLYLVTLQCALDVNTANPPDTPPGIFYLVFSWPFSSYLSNQSIRIPMPAGPSVDTVPFGALQDPMEYTGSHVMLLPPFMRLSGAFNNNSHLTATFRYFDCYIRKLF
jgi:hypothetical protein